MLQHPHRRKQPHQRLSHLRVATSLTISLCSPSGHIWFIASVKTYTQWPKAMRAFRCTSAPLIKLSRRGCRQKRDSSASSGNPHGVRRQRPVQEAMMRIVPFGCKTAEHVLQSPSSAASPSGNEPHFLRTTCHLHRMEQALFWFPGQTRLKRFPSGSSGSIRSLPFAATPNLAWAPSNPRQAVLHLRLWLHATPRCRITPHYFPATWPRVFRSLIRGLTQRCRTERIRPSSPTSRVR